jgi:ABC-type antimicrobial peptide transport system permease subunit
VRALLLGEAATVGLLGGLIGLVLARVAGLGIDLLSRKVLPEFPFKPDSYFWFSPELLLLLLGFSLVVCLLGAAWPARAAARLSPAKALSGRPG